MRELYLECYSGISGDMSVAALLDAGADKEYLLKTLATMPLTGYEVKITRVKKNGIDSCDFNKYSLSAPASRSAAKDISPLIPE